MSTPSVNSSTDSHFFGGWEEPHPGRRLSGLLEPLDHDPSRDGGVQRLEADRGSTVGTLHKATSKSLSSPDTDSIMSGFLSDGQSSAVTSPTLEVDVHMPDADKTMDIGGSSRSPGCVALRPISDYVDLSNYFDDAPTSERWSSVMELSNENAFSHVSRVADMYGWDAEWDRRVESSLPVASPRGSTNFQKSSSSRRGRVSKGNLLQRVLSVGKTPSRDSPRRTLFNP